MLLKKSSRSKVSVAGFNHSWTVNFISLAKVFTVAVFPTPAGPLRSKTKESTCKHNKETKNKSVNNHVLSIKKFSEGPQ